MAAIGMVPEEVEAVADQMELAATGLDQVLCSLSTRLQQTTWVGPDSERARADWYAQHGPTLGSSVQLLRTLAVRLRCEAADQRIRSEATGGSMTGGTGTTTLTVQPASLNIDAGDVYGTVNDVTRLGYQAFVGPLDDAPRAMKLLDGGSKLLGIVGMIGDGVDLVSAADEGDWQTAVFEWGVIGLTAASLLATGPVAALALGIAAIALDQEPVRQFLVDGASFVGETLYDAFSGPLSPSNIADTVSDVSDAALDFAGDAVDQGTKFFRSLFD